MKSERTVRYSAMAKKTLSAIKSHGDSLVEALLVLSALTLVFHMSFRAWQREYSATPLLKSQAQVAVIFQDVVTLARLSPAGAVAQVVFFPAKKEFSMYVDTGRGWRQVAPSGSVPLTLPDDVVVSSWTFPVNAMRVWVRGSKVVATAGILTLRSPNGATGEVWVQKDGTVWY